MVVFTVAQAQKFPDVKIISLDWLLESVNEGKLLDEAQYSFTDKSKNTSAPNTQPAMGKKRARAATPDEDDTQQNAPLDVNVPPVKRQKDGQKAKSGSALVVPVDEGCNLGCKQLVNHSFIVVLTYQQDSHHVYIDPDGTIYDAALNQTNVGNNNNKVWSDRSQVLYGHRTHSS